MLVFLVCRYVENLTGCRHRTMWCIWVLSCDIRQRVKWVNVVDPMFLDQYILLLEDMQFIFIPLLHVFNNSMV